MRVVIQKKSFKGNPVGSVVSVARRAARVLIAVGLAAPFQPETTDPDQAEAEAERRAAEQAKATRLAGERAAAELAKQEGKTADKQQADKPGRGRYMRRDLQAK